MANSCILSVPASSGQILGYLGVQATSNPAITTWGYQGSPFGNIGGYGTQGPANLYLYDTNGALRGTLLNFNLATIQPGMQGWLQTAAGNFWCTVQQASLYQGTTEEFRGHNFSMPEDIDNLPWQVQAKLTEISEEALVHY